MDSTFEIDVTGLSSASDDIEVDVTGISSDSYIHNIAYLPLSATERVLTSDSTLTAYDSEKNLSSSHSRRKRKKRRKTLHDYKYKEDRRRKRLQKLHDNCSAAVCTPTQFNLHIVGYPDFRQKLENSPTSRDPTATEAYSNGQVDCSSTDAYSDNATSRHVSVQTNDSAGFSLFAARHRNNRRSRQQHPPYETYLNQCLKHIQDEGFLRNLLTVLDNQNLLQHFMSLLITLENGSLAPDNIAVLLCLERAFLQTQKSTTDMRYCDKSKQFWELMYRISGGEVIRLMSGAKHFNMVNTQEVTKNKYFPAHGDFNFAVPDEKILSRSILQLPREVYPGVIEPCINLLSPNAEYFLCVDAKQCMQGLKLGLDNYGYGDIDLWGNEDPSLQSRKDDLDRDLAHIEDLLSISMDNREHLLTQVRNLAKTVNTISLSIKKVREAIVRHELLRRNFQQKIDKGQEKASRYTYAFSNIAAFKVAANDNIAHLLECNQQICSIMANLNETSHLFPKDNNIDLTSQLNCNLLMPPHQIADDSFLQRNSEFIKQRSDMWFQVRGNAHITASTMHNALGLGDATQKMNHYRQYVLKQPAKPIKPSVQEALDHGSRHEVHVISTLVSTFASAFLPDCFEYFETGSKFADGHVQKNMLCISPDGLFKCGKSMDPSHQCKCIFKLPFHQSMTVEVKSLFTAISNLTLTPVLYSPRKYHVPQTAAQMQFWDTEASLYATASLDTVSIIFLQHSKELWTRLWELCKEYYDDNHMEPPNYISDLTPECKRQVEEFLKGNSHFFCEIPLVRSKYTSDEMDVLMERDTISDNFPFHQHRNTHYIHSPRDWLQVISDLKDLLPKVKEGIIQSFELERRKATQMLLFVLSNVDRLSSRTAPLGVPIAYALRGKSLTPSTVRTLLSSLQAYLKGNNIKVLAECFDGEWAQVGLRDKDDKPLTLYELQRDTWKMFSEMSMAKALAFITEQTLVTYTDHNAMLQTYNTEDLVVSKGNLIVNIELLTSGSKTVNVYCKGGDKELSQFMSTCSIPSHHDRPELWTAYTVNIELLSILLDHARAMGIEILTSSQCICVTDTQLRSSHHLLLHTHLGKKVMESIMVALIAHKRTSKWNTVTLEELLHVHMRNSHSIYQGFTIPELELILNEILQHSTAKQLLKDLKSKADKAIFLARLLKVAVCGTKKVSKKHGLRSLRHLAMKVIQDLIPLHTLKVALATATFKDKLITWREDSPIQIATSIPVPPYTFYYFSYPEYDESNEKLLPRSVDPSHILTNLRVHATSKRGFFHCDPSAFERVSDVDNKVLNRAILTEMLDKQNCALAQSVFSEDVQRIMHLNGDLREAELVKHVRHFFQAVNDRGVHVHSRIQKLVDMATYCSRFWNPHKFPAPGMYVAGLPHVTFQCIMQCISSRIQLYHIASKRTYCQRGYSTLQVESIFSDATKICKQTKGVPMACEVPKLMSKMLHVNTTKHDPNKCFSVAMTRKSNYPVMIGARAQDICNSVYAPDATYLPHAFDFPDVKQRAKKSRKVNLASADQPLRGSRPIRDYFRIDQSKIPATVRMGLRDGTN